MDTCQSIIVTEPLNYSAEALEIYSTVGRVLLGLEPAENRESFRNCTTLVVRLGLPLDDRFLERFTSLRYVVSPTTGLNHIDLAYCHKMGIQVLSLRNETEFLNCVSATADLTFGLILALVRNIPAAHRDVTMKGRWDRDRFRGRDLTGLVLGVLGFGRLGRQVARYGRAFGMKVKACDPYVAPEVFHTENIAPCTQEGLFGSCDIVSIHVKLTEETRLLVTEKDLLLMRLGSFLVNTSRGEIIDEEALLRFLLSERLGGAALDVVDSEQDVSVWGSHPVVVYARDHDNLILTPHVGGCTKEAMEKTEIFMARKYADLIFSENAGLK